MQLLAGAGINQCVTSSTLIIRRSLCVAVQLHGVSCMTCECRLPIHTYNTWKTFNVAWAIPDEFLGVAHTDCSYQYVNVERTPVSLSQVTTRNSSVDEVDERYTLISITT